jgi:hypothetical protein
MTNRTSFLLSLALAVITVTILCRSWYLSFLYHGGYQHSELLPYLVVLFLFLLKGWTTLIRCLSKGFLVAASLLLFVIAQVSWEMLKLSMKFQPLGFEVEFALFLAILVSAFYVASRCGPLFWEKLSLATIVGVFIFVISPYLIAKFNKIPEKTIFGFTSSIDSNIFPKNFVVVIFDETSPELINPWLKLIREQKFDFKANLSVNQAGYDTINAIPAMLTNELFDDVAPCGVSTLCSPLTSIDFSDLKAARNDIDVVGFFHPYCSIRGLRSCRRVPVFFSDALKGLICSGFSASSSFFELFNCGWSRGSRDGHLVDLKERAFSAPFWKKGGVLFLHLPIPHPSMEGNSYTFSEEYSQNNISLAGEIIKELLSRLNGRFGNDFLLMITSDHPLRVEKWCHNYDNPYIGKDCGKDLPINRGVVPFIIVGSQIPVDYNLPTQNLGVFSKPIF